MSAWSNGEKQAWHANLGLWLNIKLYTNQDVFLHLVVSAYLILLVLIYYAPPPPWPFLAFFLLPNITTYLLPSYSYYLQLLSIMFTVPTMIAMVTIVQYGYLIFGSFLLNFTTWVIYGHSSNSLPIVIYK